MRLNSALFDVIVDDASTHAWGAADHMTRISKNHVCELEFVASRDFDDPWSEIRLDVEFVDPLGATHRVPAFWGGGRSWRVRYSSPVEGIHRYRSVVSAGIDTGLADNSGEIAVTSYEGTNPLLIHGAPVVSSDHRYLVHSDGTPFFWLADTWWSGMTERFRWPDVFQRLAADRVEKGFSVVQIVTGLVPEFVPFSPKMASEGGQPFLDGGKGQINPAFYSVPDLKIDHLVEKGIVPCIVIGWAFYSPLIGREKVMQHVRYIVARYAAYPVVWCVAGEVDLTRTHDYWAQVGLSVDHETDDRAEQVGIWEDASALVQEIDPFHRIRTAHPTPPITYSSSEVLRSRESFDLDMMQTGHTGRGCVPATMEHLRMSLAHEDKPVLIGECSYEGIFGSSWNDVQRFLFWSSILSGSCGHTYGTMPISTFNSRTDPHVPLSRVSMHFWEDAIDWPGSAHVGAGKRILERLPWWELQPCQEAVEPHAGPDGWFYPYAATLPDGTIVVYVPGVAMADGNDWQVFSKLAIARLRPGSQYRLTFVDPRTGANHSSITFFSEGERHALMPPRGWATPTGEDWILLVRLDESAA